LTLLKLPPKNVPITLNDGSGCLVDTVTSRVEAVLAVSATVSDCTQTWQSASDGVHESTSTEHAAATPDTAIYS
jgi:hypothetical protein